KGAIIFFRKGSDIQTKVRIAFRNKSSANRNQHVLPAAFYSIGT
ncbi:MAG: hypothetical protein ACI974_001524, partial [Paraglaciecola sp.]